MQASRKPRRRFAPALVITAAAAAAPACLVTSGDPKPKQPVTTDDHRATDDNTETVVHKNPPRPVDDGTANPDPADTAEDTSAHQGDPPGYQRNWTVDMQDDGSCLAYLEVSCKKGAICNPPPPQDVKCPTGITADGTMKIYAQSGSWDCFVMPAPAKCPEKATCNPPPPRATACPK
jgi:hypothetical protein